MLVFPLGGKSWKDCLLSPVLGGRGKVVLFDLYILGGDSLGIIHFRGRRQVHRGRGGAT